MARTRWSPSAQRHANPAFSMSFLDLLANTLGTMIFIMILLFIQVSNMTSPAPDTSKIADAEEKLREARERVEARKRELADAEAATADYESQLSDDPEAIRKQVAATLEALEKSRAEAARLEKQDEEARTKRQDAERLRDRALEAQRSGKRLPFPKGGSGSEATKRITEFYHVICDKDGLEITHQPSSGSPQMEGERVRSGDITSAGAAFRRAVEAVKAASDNSMIVFWVKPSGLLAYQAAYKVASEAQIKLGDEPAEEDLQFQGGR